VDPSGRFVYVGGSVGGPGAPPTGRIWTLQVGAGGNVSLAFSTTAALGIGIFALGVTPDGRFLYAADVVSGGGTEVHVFAANSSNGALTEVAGSMVNTGMLDAGMTLDLSGRFLYVTGNSGTVTYRVTSSGALERASSSSDPKCVFPTTGP